MRSAAVIGPMTSSLGRLAAVSVALLAFSACGDGTGEATAARGPANAAAAPTAIPETGPVDELADAVGGPVVSEAEVRQIDTAMYAELHDITIEQADTQIRQREAMQDVLDMAGAHEQYADAWIDRSDGFRMFIAFSGGVPDGFADAAEEFADTLTLVGDAPYTLEELGEQARVLTGQLLAAGFGDFGTALNGRSGTIDLTLGSISSASTPVPPAALASNVNLSLMSGPASEDEADG